jgi:hypothetical protein
MMKLSSTLIADKQTAFSLACLYFFFNSLLLPGGLYYTTLLAPAFFIFGKKGAIEPIYSWLIGLMSVYLLLHWAPDTNASFYCRSQILTLLQVPFLVSAARYMSRASTDVYDQMVFKISFLNFLLVLFALASLFVPGLKDFLWYRISITEGTGIVPRLKLFQSEASVYSFLMAPVFLYTCLLYLEKKTISLASLFLFALLPLLLSLSFGVIGVLAIAVAFTYLIFTKTLRTLERFKKYLPHFLTFGLLIFLWWKLQPDFLLFQRIANIFSGRDTSANGRTFESFKLAIETLRQYDCIYWGIGPGQFKLLGKDLLLSYYQYQGNVTDIRIPNACADLLVSYGIVGLILKLVAECLLLFSTRVYTNYYRFCLFTFLFLYQFTGSYCNNPIEWMAWVMVFAGNFARFSKARL